MRLVGANSRPAYKGRETPEFQHHASEFRGFFGPLIRPKAAQILDDVSYEYSSRRKKGIVTVLVLTGLTAKEQDVDCQPEYQNKNGNHCHSTDDL